MVRSAQLLRLAEKLPSLLPAEHPDVTADLFLPFSRVPGTTGPEHRASVAAVERSVVRARLGRPARDRAAAARVRVPNSARHRRQEPTRADGALGSNAKDLRTLRCNPAPSLMVPRSVAFGFDSRRLHQEDGSQDSPAGRSSFPRQRCRPLAPCRRRPRGGCRRDRAGRTPDAAGLRASASARATAAVDRRRVERPGVPHLIGGRRSPTSSARRGAPSRRR